MSVCLKVTILAPSMNYELSIIHFKPFITFSWSATRSGQNAPAGETMETPLPTAGERAPRGDYVNASEASGLPCASTLT